MVPALSLCQRRTSHSTSTLSLIRSVYLCTHTLAQPILHDIITTSGQRCTAPGTDKGDAAKSQSSAPRLLTLPSSRRAPEWNRAGQARRMTGV
eukprot:3085811-Rhodomonas_salina.3